MPPEQTVTIFLTEADAEKFKLFQKHYEVFTKLLETRAFDIEYGKCTINFSGGELANIIKEEMVFHR